MTINEIVHKTTSLFFGMDLNLTDKEKVDLLEKVIKQACLEFARSIVPGEAIPKYPNNLDDGNVAKAFNLCRTQALANITKAE